jgi:K+-transporting ATPase c subunit
MDTAAVRQLVEDNIEGRWLGILERRVNVLALNRALDEKGTR